MLAALVECQESPWDEMSLSGCKDVLVGGLADIPSDVPTLADLIEKDEGHAGGDIVCISAGKVQ